jgi:hypothetical protein
MDTAFEPINWGMGEIRWFKRVEGAKAQALEARAAAQARGLYDWLTRALGVTTTGSAARFSAGRICRSSLSERRCGLGNWPARTFAAGPMARTRQRTPSVQKPPSGCGFDQRHDAWSRTP